jgi:Domain of unknown function (DUF2017)
MFRRPVRRTRAGRYQLRLSAEERDLLKALPDQLKALLEDEDEPSLRRLFPPAYTDDPQRDEEYHRLMREELLERHRAALDTLERTVDADELVEEEINGWLAALNNFRLVLGTQLDVKEDEIRDDSPGYLLYNYLTMLEGDIIDALAEALSDD